MRTIYGRDLKAHLSLDDDDKVRHIRHSQEFWESNESIPTEVAAEYLRAMSETFKIQTSELNALHKPVSFFDPREQGVEYQFSEEKRLFDSVTVGYYQTYLNVPVWRRGLSVTIKQNPNRVIESVDNSEDGLGGTLPPEPVIERYRALFRTMSARRALEKEGLADEGPTLSAAAVQRVLRLPAATVRAPGARKATAKPRRVLSGKFFIYKYDPDRRYAGRPQPPDARATSLEEREPPFPRLPAVPDRIKAGRAYLVAEIIYGEPTPIGEIVWLVLKELETGTILYIESQTCGVNGLVFARDPIVSTGNLTITANQPNATLNPERDDVFLNNLDGPVAGVQNLRGTFVSISEQEAPVVAPPTTGGGDFDFDARTNNFAAVNAYYHQTELFRTIESLGFPRATYFDGTTFPIPVDHRGMGTTINAHWSPNGSGGTGHMCYALCDLSDTVNPLGRSVDNYVHWHEMGGHGTLGDHVGSGNLGFSHSAGDGLAAIQNDPDSGLRALPERFRYAPFRPFTTERRFDRPVPAWAWGSANDDGGYGSEQILATCHFRVYRSIGGDSNDVNRRRFASRVMTYLILRTIGSLTAATNPNNAQLWCERMMAIDNDNWTSEGLFGGAYKKVVRWSFEEQGSYNSQPPDVDVYIDDGRGGEYPYQPVHWHNTSIWNRNAADGLAGHQNAIQGATNYMYGKVKNRGTLAASNVTVRAYHSLPGAGLTWPTDFVEMSPVGGLNIASIGANNTQEPTVGPFQWTPNINAYGHDCVLMIASTAGDASNVDNFSATETIAEWRLVPNDNNIAQRNVAVVPAGPESLVRALDGAFFMAGNTFNRRAKMELRVDLPQVLSARGWRLEFADLDGMTFQLRPGEKRRIGLRLVAGGNFTADDVRGTGDRNIAVSLYANGMLIGGMTYYVDPDLKEPSGGKRDAGRDCRDAAQKLLDCLKVGGDVKDICVKKVTLDVEMNAKCGCD